MTRNVLRRSPLKLSPTQTRLLECFLRQPRKVLDWQAIADYVYDLSSELKTRDTVRSHLRGLRRKLATVGLEDLIATIYGLGYQLQASVAASASPTPSPDGRNEKLRAMLDRSWEQYHASICDDIAALASFNQQLLRCRTQLPAMQQRAHNLHGLLGTLAHQPAAALAADIGRALNKADLLSQLDELDAQVTQLREAIAVRPDLLVVSDDHFFNIDLRQAASQRQLTLRFASEGESALPTQLTTLQPQTVLLKGNSSQQWQWFFQLACSCQPRPTFLLANELTPDLPPALAHAIQLPLSLNCTQILDRIQQRSPPVSPVLTSR
ncbi:MAG: helix-turn-helix domain-containing protein [Spirulinaceae cyanobacterium RM2_2_10]|nr:helix-turn-helix domain-containing protein [Spirulinaceae cyanobacterium RM2_2_10]